ncbi:hypothetical protein BDV12DRAFT_39672 [Aspergillus spectabilis]
MQCLQDVWVVTTEPVTQSWSRLFVEMLDLREQLPTILEARIFLQERTNLQKLSHHSINSELTTPRPGFKDCLYLRLTSPTKHRPVGTPKIPPRPIRGCFRIENKNAMRDIHSLWSLGHRGPLGSGRGHGHSHSHSLLSIQRAFVCASRDTVQFTLTPQRSLLVIPTSCGVSFCHTLLTRSAAIAA